MTELKKLKLQHTDCYYDADMDAICIDVNEDPQTVAEEAKELIEWHYEGRKHPVNSGSNPEDETWETATGKEFIEYEFGGDYHQAFDQV